MVMIIYDQWNNLYQCTQNLTDSYQGNQGNQKPKTNKMPPKTENQQLKNNKNYQNLTKATKRYSQKKTKFIASSCGALNFK